jgi:hypothetical protein
MLLLIVMIVEMLPTSIAMVPLTRTLTATVGASC